MSQDPAASSPAAAPAGAPPPPASADAALQFDRADFGDESPAPAPERCAQCGQGLVGHYYTANGAVVCVSCREKLLAHSAAPPTWSQLGRAALWGAGGAAAGAAAWGAIRAATGYELGLVAIGVGILVGYAVRRGAGGRGGKRLQALAMALTYLSITVTYVPAVITAIRQQAAAREGAGAAAEATVPAAEEGAPQGATRSATAADAGRAGEARTAPANSAAIPGGSARAPAEQPPGILIVLLALAVVFAIALAAPFLGGAQNIMGIIIIGIGLYEAWKITRATPVQLAGPFVLAAAPPAASSAALAPDPLAPAPPRDPSRG